MSGGQSRCLRDYVLRSAIPVVAAVAVLAFVAHASPRAAQATRNRQVGENVAAVQARLAELSYLAPNQSAGRNDDATRQAVLAFQGWEGLPRDGVAGLATRRRLLAASRPRPTSGLRGGLEIHTYQQVLLLVKNGRAIRAIHISTGGAGTPTPHGNFRVTSRQRMSFSRPFEVWMPFALYFVGGIALHEYQDVPAWPASHGCVRMPASEAEGVYRWSGPGTPVWVGP